MFVKSRVIGIVEQVSGNCVQDHRCLASTKMQRAPFMGALFAFSLRLVESTPRNGFAVSQGFASSNYDTYRFGAKPGFDSATSAQPKSVEFSAGAENSAINTSTPFMGVFFISRSGSVSRPRAIATVAIPKNLCYNHCRPINLNLAEVRYA